MNRLFYRLIFNAARQMVMVVADITRSYRAGPVGSGNHRPERCLPESLCGAIKPGVMLLWLSLGMVSSGALAAPINPDSQAPGQLQPTVISTQSGIPQINIQTPGRDGVSRNRYSQFDVGQRGAILNNSSAQVKTRLAGHIQGNPWLAKGEAKIILNEVNSRNPSQLRGFIEVAGKRADVILANPAGITCSGCGFINADRSLLVAGKTLIESGKIKGFEIDKGSIAIQGKGFKDSESNYTALIARSVNINARVHARHLAITTGRNIVGTDGKTPVKTDASPEGESPDFALDVAALGGMYAQTITLRGTEKGVGVRHAGHIGAEAGSITLSAAGKISTSGILSANQHIVLDAAQSITHGGTMVAQQNITLNSGQTIAHTGQANLVAGQHVTLRGKAISSQPTTLLAAGFDSRGKPALAGSLKINTESEAVLQGQMRARKEITAKGNKLDLSSARMLADHIDLSSATDILTRESHIHAAYHASLTATGGLDNRRGELVADRMTLRAPEFIDNRQGKLVQHGRANSKLETRRLNNQQGEISLAGDSLLAAQQLNNASGKLIVPQGTLGVKVQWLDNVQGRIAAPGKQGMTLDAEQLESDGGQLLTGGALALSGSSLSLNKGSLQAAQIALQANTLSLREGSLLQTGKEVMTLTLKSQLDNHRGSISSEGGLHLQAHHMDNRGGQVIVGGTSPFGDLQLSSPQLDGENGRIVAKGKLSLTGGDLRLSRAITQGGTLDIRAKNMSHSLGNMLQTGCGKGAIVVDGQLDNRKGHISSSGPLRLEANALQNIRGQVSTDKEGALVLKTRQEIDNTRGVLFAERGLVLYSDQLTNREGKVQSLRGDLQISAARLVGQSGELQAQGSLRIEGKEIDLTAARTRAQQITLTASQLMHRQGSLSQCGEQPGTLNITGALNNNAGKIEGNGSWLIRAGTLNNQQGELVSAKNGKLELHLERDLDNAGGTLSGHRGAEITASSFINRRGKVTAGQGDISLTAPLLDGNGGEIVSGRQLTLNSEALSLRNALTQAEGIHLVAQRLDHQGGRVLQTGNQMAEIRLQGPLNNRAGSLEASSLRITMPEQHFDNSQGRVLARQKLLLDSGKIDNLQGTLHSAGDMQIDTHGAPLQNTSSGEKGGIVTQGALILTTGVLNNQHGRIVAEGPLTLTSQGSNNQQGTVGSRADVAIASGAWDNRKGTIRGESIKLNTQGQQLTNYAEPDRGQGIFARHNLTITAGEVLNRQGYIEAQNIGIASQPFRVDNARGEMLATDKLTLTAGAVDNQQGRIEAGQHLVLDASRGEVNNQNTQHSGGLLSGMALSLSSSSLLNGGGRVALLAAQASPEADSADPGANPKVSAGLMLNTLRIENPQGEILSDRQLQIDARQLNNSGGTLEGLKMVALAIKERIANQQGRIKARDTLTISTQSLNNERTLQGASGIEGQNISLTADEISNRGGALRATQGVAANIARRFDNDRGLISAETQLSITDSGPRTGLALHNHQGTLISMGSARIQASELVGDGKLVARQDLTLDIRQPAENRGRIQAGKTLKATFSQGFLNKGLFSSLGELALTTTRLTNTISGEISGVTTRLNASRQILNSGLIDGELTHITANSLANRGSGRIYGDALAIAVATLSNDKQQEKAATIAGRKEAHIAAGALLNRDHALIYSDGDLHIGGQLTDQLKATGQAKSVKNHSASIQAAGDLFLSANVFENKDIHLRLSDTPVEVEREHFTWFDAGNGQRYKIQPRRGNRNRYAINDDGSLNKQVNINYERSNRWRMLESGRNTKNFFEYDYDRMVYETGILNHDPALITSGKNLQIDGQQLRNVNGRIVAGLDLILKASHLNNQAAQGIRRIVEKGKTIYRYKGGGKWHTRAAHYDYQGVNREEKIPLHLLDVIQHAGESKQTIFSAAQKHVVSGPAIPGSGPEAVAVSEPVWRLSSRAPVALRADRAMEVSAAESPSTPINSQDPALAEIVLPGGSVDSLGRAESVTLQAAQPAVSQQPFFAAAVPREQQMENMMIRTIGPNITLPDNSLFTLHPGSNSQYLIETDPRFTQHKKWLSSIDILNHAQLHKRLGDGYYEQRLAREQLIATLGQALTGDYRDEQEQYRGLLTSGVAFAKKFNLTPGVALSAQQMSHLTSDMVWMVNKEVTLPNGRVESVSVPQVYVRAPQGDLKSNGALLAGRNVRADLIEQALTSGEIRSRQMTAFRADSLLNSGRIQGRGVQLTTLKDTENIGGEIQGQESVTLTAGRDIRSVTAQGERGASAWLERPATMYVTGNKGQLRLEADRDIRLAAAQIDHSGMEGKTLIAAGRDIHLETRNISSAFDYTRNKSNYYRGADSTEVGTRIDTRGAIALSAGQDLSARAANLSGGSGLTAHIGRDIHIEAGTETRYRAKHAKSTDKGFLSSTTKESHDELHTRSAKGSTFSGDTLSLTAERQVTIVGSNLPATHDLSLTAGKTIAVIPADEAIHETHMQQTTRSGLMSSGGIGFTVGQHLHKTTSDTESNQKKGSVIGSVAGDVILQAGETATLHGSEVIAGNDIRITGSNIAITAAENSRTALTTVETRETGLTLSLGGSVGAALDNMVQSARSAREEDDSQLAALKGVKAALYGAQAMQSMRLSDAQGSPPSVGVKLSLGSSASKSVTKTGQQTASGSQLSAGRHINLTAAGKNGVAQGNITVAGSQLKASENITLSAENDISLSSASNTQKVESKNKSQGTTVGVGYGTDGFSVSASHSQAKGFAKGNSQFFTDSEVNAGKVLALSSGKNTTLTGAQVRGEKVTATVGGNLTLSSQQASSKYNSKQTSSSVGGSFSQGGGGSFSLSMSQTRINSDYQSVDKQTAIEAGKGGFDIRVGRHTALNGAAISSAAHPEKNSLDTGTLSFSSINNKAKFEAKSSGVSFSSGGAPAGGQFISNAAGSVLNSVGDRGKASSTTYASLAEGRLIVRDRKSQQQDLSDLRRDARSTHQPLKTIFDQDKVQKRIDKGKLIWDAGQQITDIALTQASLNAANSVDRRHPGLKGEAREAAIQAEINQSGWGIGGDNRRLAEAGALLIQGLASGDISQAAARASAPYIAHAIGQNVTDDKAKLAAHGIASVALALATGEDPAARTLGAITAEATGMLSEKLYGKPAAKLSESEKATVSAFASLAAGIAASLTGEGIESAARAAEAGKTVVENNYLSFDEAREFDKAITKCRAEGSDCQPVIDHYSKLNKINSDKYKADCDRYSLNCTAGYERLKLDGGISAAERPTWLYGSLDNEDVRNAVLYENQKDLEYGMGKSDNWDRLGAFVAEPENTFGLLAGGKTLFSSNISIGAKLTGAGLSMSANGGVQLYNGNTGDKFDYLSFFSSGVTGWGGTGKSLQTNMGLNVGNAYLTSQVSGQDSEAAMVGAGFGTMLGYGLGSSITSKMEAAEIKEHFGMSASKKAFEYSDKSRYSNFLTEGTKFSPSPGIIGGTAGSGVLEYSGSRVNNNIVSDKNNERVNDTKPQDKNKDNQ